MSPGQDGDALVAALRLLARVDAENRPATAGEGHVVLRGMPMAHRGAEPNTGPDGRAGRAVGRGRPPPRLSSRVGLAPLSRSGSARRALEGDWSGRGRAPGAG
ncbi:hypothetical protein ACFU53_23790 [Streptomyces sp. NPDC057474]|uniref:hypothetical protein n=1 Tax=Streptomyces sp. NPDC057474 TaxID=3346144 RepID=UPI003677A9EB